METGNNAAHKSQPEAAPGKRRLRNFLATYLSGAAIVAVYYGLTSSDPLGIVIAVWACCFVAGYLPFGMPLAVDLALRKLFPARTDLILYNLEADGFGPGVENIFAGLLLGLSYLLCIVIPIVGGMSQKERNYQILFIIFVLLILLNIFGCIGVASVADINIY